MKTKKKSVKKDSKPALTKQKTNNEKLELRPYQLDVVKKSDLKNATPFGWQPKEGKTEVSINAINKFISENPDIAFQLFATSPRRNWTIEDCRMEGLKYISKKAWETNSRNSYQAALRNGWLPQCCGHMTSIVKPKGYWTKEKCVEEAKKYQTRSDWKSKSVSAYNTAHKNKWIEECVEHMIIASASGIPKYNSLKEWKEASPESYKSASSKGLLIKICKIFGWEYGK